MQESKLKTPFSRCFYNIYMIIIKLLLLIADAFSVVIEDLISSLKHLITPEIGVFVFLIAKG